MTSKVRERGLLQLVRIVVLLLLSCALPCVFAQELHSSINKNDAKALAAVSDILVSNDHFVGSWLADHGYQPADIQTWNNFPVVRKLEGAYLAAEKAAPKRGGQTMLALLSSDLAKQYESVRFDSTLKPYIGAVSGSVVFDSTTLMPPLQWHAPRKIAMAFSAISAYAEGGAFGGPHVVLQSYFGVPEATAYDILRTSNTTAEAIQRGLAWVPESERKPRLELLVADIDHAYGHGARQNRDLDIFRASSPGSSGPTDPNSHSPTQPDRPRSGPGGPAINIGPSTPVAPPYTQAKPEHATEPTYPGNLLPITSEESSARYSNFVRENYSVSPGMSAAPVFTEMVEVVEGFGGVVFGNSVATEHLPGRPESLRWVAAPHLPEDADPSGRLFFRFKVTSTDGSASWVDRSFGPVLLEDAYAAHQIVFGRYPGVPSFNSKSGIGLVGIYDRARYFDIADGKMINEGDRWRIVMHPALTNLQLGWSALMVDALPIRKNLLNVTRQHLDPAQEKSVEEWLSHTPGNWKFTEAPLVITTQGPSLVVKRREPISNDEYLKKIAFLSVKPFDGDTEDSEKQFSEGFPRALPALIQSSDAFERLNRFAAVLAVFRWAATAGVRFEGVIDRPKSVPTPKSIVITNVGYIVVPDYEKPEDAQRELRAKLDAYFAQVTVAPELEAFLKDQQKDWRTIGEQEETIFHARRQAHQAEHQIEDSTGRLERTLSSASPEQKRQLQALIVDLQKTRIMEQLTQGSAVDHEKAMHDLKNAEESVQRFLSSEFPTFVEEEQHLRSQITQASETAKNGYEQVRASCGSLIDKQTEMIKTVATPEVKTEYESLLRELTVQENAAEDAHKKEMESQKKLDEIHHAIEESIQTKSVSVRARYRESKAAVAAREQDILGKGESGTYSIKDVLASLSRAEEALLEVEKQYVPDLAREQERLESEAEKEEASRKELLDSANSLEQKRQELVRKAFPVAAEWFQLLPKYTETEICDHFGPVLSSGNSGMPSFH